MESWIAGLSILAGLIVIVLVWFNYLSQPEGEE